MGSREVRDREGEFPWSEEDKQERERDPWTSKRENFHGGKHEIETDIFLGGEEIGKMRYPKRREHEATQHDDVRIEGKNWRQAKTDPWQTQRCIVADMSKGTCAWLASDSHVRSTSERRGGG
jgi:hypothetical protein